MKILTTMLVLASAFWAFLHVNGQTLTRLNLSILAWTNTYNLSGVITLPSRTSSFAAVSKDVSSGTFVANSFVVQDLKWSDAWSVLVAFTDLVGPNGTINSWNIFMRVNTAVSLTWDATCWANSAITATWTGMNSARTLRQKAGNWKVCRAGVTPTIWVDIPASQAIWDYISTGNFQFGTLTYNGGLTY